MRFTSAILILLFKGIFFFYLAANLNAQVLNVDYYSIENGLSQTSVLCIIQDSRGFLWIGTQDGLNRFDGYTFKIYKNNPADSLSLSNNYINGLFEDSEGFIWVATNYGLNRYNPVTEEFQVYLPLKDNLNSLRENQVYDIYQDNLGFIWIKTDNFLSRLNLRNNTFRHYEHYNDVFSFIPTNPKFPIFEDHKGQLWIGTKDGLNYFDRKLEIFKHYKNDPNDRQSISNDRVKVIFEDSRKNLWIGTENGLNKFDWATERFTRYNTSHNLCNNNINEIFEDNNGKLWIGTDDGLNVYNYEADNFIVYDRFLYNSDQILATSFSSIIQDKTGVLWIGSLQGLLKIKERSRLFKLYNKRANGEPLFSNNYIASLFEKDGTVWVGTWGTGLFLFNPKKLSVVRYSTENSNIINDYVHAIFEDSRGRIWIGTQNGLCHFNEKTRSFENIKNVSTSPIFKNNRVYDIIEDSEGIIWVATKFGLHKIQEDTLFSYINNPTDTVSLTANLVFDLMQDKNGDIWIATQRGLNRFNKKTQTITTSFKATNCKDCFDKNEILYLYEDTALNCIWVGTVAGLYKYDLLNNSVLSYTEEDGLPNNLIYSILPDNLGNLWISTNRGLTKFNQDNEDFTNFNVADGLQDNEFNHGASFKSKSGELFFGGISGYNSFYPDSIATKHVIPEVVITSIEVITKNGIQNLQPTKDNYIEIPFSNNLITIEFAVMDFTNPQKNSFQYKLEGSENEWINIGNRHFATFSNLPSGRYTFYVKGANSDHLWSNEGAMLKINVITPIWKSKLAYLVYIVLLGTFIFWFFQYRTRSLRKANQELKEKEEIAKQVAIQKEELVLKNKNITDSILYAKRIQEALMPPLNRFYKILPHSFILHKAKDIVSGDFYWINQKKDKIFIAVVDCTGHGVPGAFMSIIGFELLRKITDDQGVDDAAQILKDLNKGVATTFGMTADNIRLKDGMDIALCIIDNKKAELEFAGAFRPLYFIRDNKIQEIRGDRFSVGLLSESEAEEVTSTHIKLKKNDIFYIFSDGYADQFGGPEGKKFKYRRFRHLLLTIHKLQPEQQFRYLEKTFDDWKANYEQVDDILIVGFRPELE
ncbi:MAG TPA: two-component regulator propeller domain-containing protein [Bacteroidales bacterium]|nr:two-component regulator propeller domain-containing protein [Bacteroidales bacterium]